MELEDAGQLATVRLLIRDRDAKYPALIDEILGHAGITTVLTGIQMPRMNAIVERWVKTLRVEPLDRTLIWNETHLRRALRTYERYYNQHRVRHEAPHDRTEVQDHRHRAVAAARLKLGAA